MGKYVKHIKIVQNLLKGSLTAIDSFLKAAGNLFLISNTEIFENRTINTKDMGENVQNIKIAKNLLKNGPTVL